MRSLEAKRIAAFLVLIGFFAVDRLTKLLFIKKFPDGEFFIWPGLIKLELYYNTGIAFSLPLPAALIITAYTAILFVLIVAAANFWRRRQYLTAWLLGLVFIGGISNLIDRLRFGGVIDFIDLRFYSVFNLSDCFIVGGVLLLIYFNYFKKGGTAIAE